MTLIGNSHYRRPTRTSFDARVPTRRTRHNHSEAALTQAQVTNSFRELTRVNDVVTGRSREDNLLLTVALFVHGLAAMGDDGLARVNAHAVDEGPRVPVNGESLRRPDWGMATVSTVLTQMESNAGG